MASELPPGVIGGEPFGQGTSLTLSELTGEDPVTLELAGRALPYRPVGFSGTMRAEFTWYPGNPTATVQVFGSQEDPTTMHGMWKTKYLAKATEDGATVQNTALATVNNVDITSALELVQEVDRIRRRGQLLRFQWDAIIRKGILTKFSYEFDNRLDIHWEMTFTWINQGEEEVAAVLSNLGNLSSVSGSWSSTVARMRNAITQPFNRITNSMQKALVQAENALDGTAAIGDTVTATVDAAYSPIETAQKLAGIFDQVIDRGAQIKETISSQFTNLQFVKNYEDAAEQMSQSFYDRLVNLSWQREVYESASEMEAQGALQKSEALKQITPDVVESITARFGQDLRDISLDAYGTANEWRTLLVYNGFTQSELQAGQVVLIPKLNTLSTSNG